MTGAKHLSNDHAVKVAKAMALLWVLFCALATISCRQKRFAELTPSQTGISFVNEVYDTDSLNILTYPYFYNGGGVALADFDNDGLTDVFLTANRRGGNRLYRNRGQLRFEDVTQRAGVVGRSDWNTGVTVADVNADGWLDIYVCGVHLPGLLNSRNELYVNQRNGTFREEAARYGLAFRGHSTQAAFFDADHDGDLDCFLLNHAVTLRDDYRDASARSVPDSASGSKFLENRNGQFIDVTQSVGIHSGAAFGLGLAVGDLNGDGWTDVYVGNDFRENDYAYLNTGTGRFTDQATALFGHHSRFTMGCDLTDVDNDGRLDALTLDMLPADERVVKASLGDDDAEVYDYKRGFGFYHQVSRNTLHLNRDGWFSDQALLRGVAATDWSWCPLVADFTNDGRKDLIITNGIQRRTNDLDFTRFINQPEIARQYSRRTGLPDLISHMPTGTVADYAFEQLTDSTGNWSFADRSADWGFDRPTLSNGAACADLDRDGDLDVVVNRVNEPAGVYENRGKPGHWLSLKLTGPAGNRFGVGATVWVYAGGVRQRHEIMPTRGFLSAGPPVVHAGLGTADRADSVAVVWPGGRRQTLRSVRANQPLTLRYADAAERWVPPAQPPTPWRDVAREVGLSWQHREDEFSDLTVNPFLPHRLSTEGPALAVGDVNGDGLDDCYLGGAAGQSGALFVQQTTGAGRPVFVETNRALWAADAGYEDVDALFFDADGDRDLDLYVVSGGNQHTGTHPLLLDRLYRNNGRGQFRKDSTLPGLYDTKSCVRAADFDRDGDLDLFVGGRASARMYGRTPASALLLNDNGTFQVAPEAAAPGLERVGMVTDARWTDLDRDGWPDLIVVGEWMPVTIFRNRQGRLLRDTAPALTRMTGLWTCIEPVPGLPEPTFVLGNWGLNSKLRATTDAPLRLYVADYDHNGEDDPLLAVSRNGHYYPFLGKEDLERRLPYLKKRYLKAADLAGQPIDVIFGDELSRSTVFNANYLQTSLLRLTPTGPVLSPLPTEVQAAPVRCLLSVGARQVLLAGNFYGATPYEGRYDAGRPRLLFIAPAGQASYEPALPIDGTVRHCRSLKLADGRVGLLLVRNNGALSLVRR